MRFIATFLASTLSVGVFLVYQCLNFVFVFQSERKTSDTLCHGGDVYHIPSHVVLTLLILKSMSVGVPGKTCLVPI